MTREEAIEYLQKLYLMADITDEYGDMADTEPYETAIDMAIEALQNKSRPFGDCSKCIHTYGTLGCCTTVNNEWLYDCEHGMEQYKNTKADEAKTKCIARIEVDTEEVVKRIKEEYSLDNAPTIDAVEVVRCKDCKHYDQAWDKRGACFNSKGVFGILNDDDYCSYGERREP